jgi:uncharacterized protein YegP (UPF0339 family)
MAFQLARRIRTVMLMVPVCPESGCGRPCIFSADPRSDTRSYKARDTPELAMTSIAMVKPAGGRQDELSSEQVRRRSHQGGNMAGKFVLKKSSNGKYHFNLVATNGQVIASSEMYERKASALNGIESVQKNAPGAEVDDQTGD